MRHACGFRTVGSAAPGIGSGRVDQQNGQEASPRECPCRRTSLVGADFGEQFINPEAPIDVAPEDNPTNEPEPDLVVLTKPSREFRDANPRPSELRLVVEISDSTLGFDLTTKAELYARAGIVEYWVVDVAARRLIVHRVPREGLYPSVIAYNEEEHVTPLASPGREFPAPKPSPSPSPSKRVSRKSSPASKPWLKLSGRSSVRTPTRSRLQDPDRRVRKKRN